ncbi:hypothetical protein ACMYSQ_012375 [Aspergillus niger]
MPQHLTKFRLSTNTRAAEEVISGLREHLETEAFGGIPKDEVYAESPLDSDALDRLIPILSLVRDGKQWNQDFKETVYQIHRSLFGNGTKKGTTRGKATSS